MAAKPLPAATRPMGSPSSLPSFHGLGVLCGIAAGAWLGAAEAPTKLVNAGFSPFAISLCMVAGVFVARWTFPTLIKGTSYVFRDLLAKRHLIVWALLAGALWSVANTLTVFAIRDVGLSIAFPLWNTNSLIGLLWGRMLFRELQGAGRKQVAQVVLGAICIVLAAILLGFSTIHGSGSAAPHAVQGLLAAAGASLLWGTMYIPYRKAYISGLNPLSFVTAFTASELATMFVLTWTLDGGAHSSAFHLLRNGNVLFWLFLGGFIWVVGDVFQQYATKYLGIGRGIPLSNTNQLWGLAWGVLVFGELTGASHEQIVYVLSGSILMIFGALAISISVPSAHENLSRNAAIERECDRYGMDYREVLSAHGGRSFRGEQSRRRWWDIAILCVAVGLFVWPALHAAIPPIILHTGWALLLTFCLLAALLGSGWALWRHTRFE